MAATPSSMIPLGTSAPDFKLLDTVSGREMSLADVKGKKGTVVMFICNHCPFVLNINEQLVKLGNEYLGKEIGFVAISSNDVINYPQDRPEKMRTHAQSVGYPFPYLYDESQEVAKSYHAACTPDFFLFDSDLKCVYRGQLDDSRPNTDIPVNGQDLRHALECLLLGKSNIKQQQPSIGCNIKWKR